MIRLLLHNLSWFCLERELGRMKLKTMRKKVTMMTAMVMTASMEWILRIGRKWNG